MNSIIKVYNLSLEDATNTRSAGVAKDAALTELNQIIEKGCLMLVDPLTENKLKSDRQLILPLKLFLKVKYQPDGTFDHIMTNCCPIISTYDGSKISHTRE